MVRAQPESWIWEDDDLLPMRMTMTTTTITATSPPVVRLKPLADDPAAPASVSGVWLGPKPVLLMADDSC